MDPEICDVRAPPQKPRLDTSMPYYLPESSRWWRWLYGLLSPLFQFSNPSAYFRVFLSFNMKNTWLNLLSTNAIFDPIVRTFGTLHVRWTSFLSHNDEISLVRLRHDVAHRLRFLLSSTKYAFFTRSESALTSF